MPRNGSGQYNPLTNTWNPPVTGVLATGADFQAQLNDISAAITQSVSKDGQTPMTANLPMGNNSIVGIASGTQTSPSISANGDANTGLYFPAADTVAIATGGVKRVEVDANGSVGVGVTPSSNWATSGKKVIQLGSGGVLYGDNALAQQVTLGSNWTYDGTTQKYLTTAAAAVYQQNFGGHSWFTAPSGTAGNPITFTQAMTLDANGNLGIATTSPTSKLHVKGSFRIESEGAQWFSMGAGASGASYGAFLRGGTTTLVGLIGTDGGAILSGGTGDNFGIRAESALLLAAGATERARITSDGNLLVGITSPYLSSDCRLEVFGSPSSASTFRAIGHASAGAGTIHLLGVGGITNGYYITKDGVNNITHIWDNQSVEAARITSDGNLLVGYNTSNGVYKLQVNSQIFATSSTIATSDGRYKENITPIDGALNLVKELNPVQFSWKKHPVHAFDTEIPAVGFIAQELQQVLSDRPYLNSVVKCNECTITAAEYETIEIEPAEEEIKDEDGNVLVSAKPAITEQRLVKPAVTEKFLGIAEGNLIAILTKAIQEQQALIEAQKTAIESLTVRITALEAK